MYRCMGCMAEITENTPQCPHCGYQRGTAPMEAYHLAPETILQGRYIVGRVLGYGGFGVTYIGWDAQLERTVAIKEFLPSTFATRMPGGTSVTVFDGPATEQFSFGLQRFLDEAQRLAQFNSIPGITDIYDTFSQNNTAYIVMQFLNGQDVKAILTAKGPMPYEEARDIIIKICDTLAPVHQTGIIHRDLSPDNIYITADGEVKLLDFGAARYESGANSKSLSVILKSGYAPEEQYRSKGEQGSWTDVYALAATFYKMLTGVTPPDSLERAVNDEIKEPSKLGAQMPQSAENALMNALNIHKRDRTQTVQQFKEALLADGVERVKVKPRKADSGRLPLAGKIAIGAAVLVLIAGGIALALMNGEDQIVIGETAKLTDTYGNAVADGQALVPNIVGMDRDAAAKALEDAGLVLTEGSRVPSPTLAQNVVATQQPQPGGVLDEGAEVTVGVSAGTFWQAYDDGLLPQFEGITAAQAVAQFEALEQLNPTGNPYWGSYHFENSDTVPEGTVIRYDEPEKRNTNSNYVTAVVSAGPQGNYHIRAPFLYDSFNMMYAAPEDENWAESETVLQASTDGAQWHTLIDLSQGYVTDEDKAAGYITRNYEGFQNAFVNKYPEMIGQTVQLRVSWQEGGQTQTAPLPQQLVLEELPAGNINIESMQFVTWDEIQELYDQGILDQNNDAVRFMENDLENMQQQEGGEEGQPYNMYNHPPVVVRGVLEYSDYAVRVAGVEGYSGAWMGNYHNSVDKDSVVTTAFTLGNRDIGYEAENGRNYDTDVLMYATEYEYGSIYSIDGATVTAYMSKPLLYTVTPSPALAALLGAPAKEPQAGGGAMADGAFESENMEKAAAMLTEIAEAGKLELNTEDYDAILAEVSMACDIPVDVLENWLKEMGYI